MGLWEKYIVPPIVACACQTKPIMKQRAKVVPMARGRILEVGCGAGTNFDFYDMQLVEHLYALEPSGGMIKRAKAAASRLEWRDRIEFIEAGAEDVPLPDASIDTVVLTFVLCTIPDWQGALAEARRVLQPDGQILFTEHGLAPDQGVIKWQRRIEPVWKPLVGGCHLTRDTLVMLVEGGFALDDVKTMYLPSTPRFAGYVSWGGARAA